MKKFIFIALGLVGLAAFAVAESGLIDIHRGPKPQWFQSKLYGSSAIDNAPSSTENGISGTFAVS